MTLIEAAKDVVARWDSPDWHDGTHTGEYIARLRAAIEEAEKQEPVARTELVESAPKRIWLGVFDDIGCEEEPFPENHEDICWCSGPIGAFDVPYVRADLAAAAHTAG